MSDRAGLLAELGSLPCENGEPVFESPWQAKTFAMVLQLHESGAFSWTEWAHELSQNIAEYEATAPIKDGDDYYTLWQLSLERIVERKGLISG